MFASRDSGLILTKQARNHSGEMRVIPINRAEAEEALSYWKKKCEPHTLSLIEVPDAVLDQETPMRIALNLRYNY